MTTIMYDTTAFIPKGYKIIMQWYSGKGTDSFIFKATRKAKTYLVAYKNTETFFTTETEAREYQRSLY